MNPFRSLRDYEKYIYTLNQQFSSIQRSTLVIIKRGKRTAVLQGELMFANGYHLALKERLAYDHDTLVIENYGYELWCNAEKLTWYDAQPHPNNPALASTHPHHQHIHPDIKHHRIPAPNMSFTQPNLAILIQEIEKLIATPTTASVETIS